MDKELSNNFDVNLCLTDFDDLSRELVVISHGAIVLTRRGTATFNVNYKRWFLPVNSVIVLFPGDVVQVERSDDFEAQVLSYGPSMLREASLQMETVVYDHLREDRCRGDQPVVSGIVSHIFGMLGVFFATPDCACLDELVLYQLKALFLGFYDFLRRNPQQRPKVEGSRRVNYLFGAFLQLINDHYRESRDVAFYADRLNISTKYLSQIVNKKTGRTPKTIIDHYVIMQLKMILRTSHESVKQLSWKFHFNDDSFFCRYFKQHTGLTPQQYRKDMTGE